MTVDVHARSEPIATGRTWRDIPPQPPAEAPAAIPLPPEPPGANGRGPQRLRIAALVALLALTLGIALGQWAPWEDGRATDALAARPQSESAGPRPGSTTTLPPRIVPPPAEEPLVPESVLPEDFFRFEGFPDLSELFGEDFGRAPGFGTGGPVALISLDELPEGYQNAGMSLQSTSGRVTQQFTLLGPAGPVRVRAERSAGAALPAGGSQQIGGVAGVLAEGDPTIFAWEATEDVIVTIEVPESAATELLESLVPSVEIVQ